MGLNAQHALRENTALFARELAAATHRPHPIHMFGQDATLLFAASYVIALAERLQRDASPA